MPSLIRKQASVPAAITDGLSISTGLEAYLGAAGVAIDLLLERLHDGVLWVDLQRLAPLHVVCRPAVSQRLHKHHGSNKVLATCNSRLFDINSSRELSHPVDFHPLAYATPEADTRLRQAPFSYVCSKNSAALLAGRRHQHAVQGWQWEGLTWLFMMRSW